MRRKLKYLFIILNSTFLWVQRYEWPEIKVDALLNIEKLYIIKKNVETLVWGMKSQCFWADDFGILAGFVPAFVCLGIWNFYTWCQVIYADLDLELVTFKIIKSTVTVLVS